MAPSVSVMMATRNRAGELARTLDTMCSLRLSRVSAELIIIDNGSTDNTKEVVERFRDRLPIKYCVEPKPGKNVALNSGLEIAGGELLVFTDDDVLVEPDWLTEWSAGASRWPEYSVFGGPILPEWPGPVPAYITDMPFLSPAYAILNPEQEEGLFIDDGMPFGPNLAVRRCIFQADGYRFNESIGPSGSNYIMGSETELLRRLRNAGQHAIFLPRTGVRHVIRSEQLTPKWLYGRAYRFGRTRAFIARNDEVGRLCGLPRYLLRLLFVATLNRLGHLLRRNKIGIIYEGMRWWEIWGQLRQARDYWFARCRDSLHGETRYKL